MISAKSREQPQNKEDRMSTNYTDPEELFDVVNERDEVIGQLPRREVHRRGLRHRAVHVLIYNSKGEVFLQKRSAKKDTFPQRWDSSAAGHLNPGEPYDACAVREVEEELGFVLPCVPERILRLAACAETGQEFVWVYRCTAEGPFRLHPDEIETGDWFASEQVTRWIANSPDDFAPSLVCIWHTLHALSAQKGKQANSAFDIGRSGA
jgi:isopentenyl-diphosphate delta-isomerase type 1